MPLKYLIDTQEDWADLVQYIKDEEIFAYDTETNGKFSQFDVSLVGISFGFDDFACYVPVNHRSGRQLPIGQVLQDLKPIFEDPTKRYIAHHTKFDEMVLAAYGIECAGSGDDTLVMAWLLDEGRTSKGLKPLTLRHLGIRMETYEDVIAKQPKRRGVDRDYDFSKVSLRDALSYAADDAYYTLELYHLFIGKLRAEKLDQAYERIERPLTRVVRFLESRGVEINRELIDEASERLPEIAEELEAQIYEQAGEVFKIGSGQQLGRILFEKLGIGKNVPRTKTGHYSTDKKTLKLYASKHEVVANVLRRKKIQKTHSVFVEGLKQWIEKDGRIHPSFNPVGTVTGRFSSREPNLQQIEGDEVESFKIRDFFVPASGKVFVVGDYSQIELRILAHLSEDENMINAFLSGRDFHDETGRLMLKMQGNPIPISQEVSGRQRFNAKALNFGIPYGRGPASVAEQLDVEPICNHWPRVDREASEKRGMNVWIKATSPVPCHNCGKCFITDWFEGYAKVLEFKDKTIAEATARGFIRTLAGRKRRLLPEIRSSNMALRAGAQRQAFNSKIQGSAADIIKLAMVGLHEPLKELGAGMLMTIHDELLVESPRETAEDVRVVMKQIMEKPLNGKNPLRLPMIAEPKIVEKWGDAK